MELIEYLKTELEQNVGRIPLSMISNILNSPNTKVTHKQITPNTRVCVITTLYGHDLVGYAQVLDAKNDVELIGQEVAYDNAKEQLWAILGSIAKVI